MSVRTSASGSIQSGGSDASLTARQWVLLRLLDGLGGAAKNLDFQKVLFLYCQEPDSGKPYDFVPYKYGAFSFTSYSDRRKLIARGLVAEDDGQWKLTPEGRLLTEGDRDILLAAFLDRLSGLKGDELVAETYRRFPFFAIRSEIADRILEGEPDALARIQSEKRTTDATALTTLGYEGHSLESYLNELFKAGVTLLCDVRRNPISRKYGFSKSTLSHACEHLGVRYEHLPELGIPSDQRQDLSTQADYDALFKQYKQKWLPKQHDALKKIESWVDEGYRVALTCFEHLPGQCHRHCVAEALEAKFGEQYHARHL